jgi:hypothetical protein
MTPAPAADLRDPRWWYDLDWLCGGFEAETPEQRRERLLRRLAKADPTNPVEMAWLVERAAEIAAANAA